jgi:uncharacterized repeat protein (TIGR03803 family)
MSSQSGNRRTVRALAVAGLVFGAALSLAGVAQATTLSTLYTFCSLKGCADGRYPQAELAMDAAGDLYGTTAQGGSNGDDGVVFELIPNADKSAWQYQLLHKFCAKDCRAGDHPAGGVILDAAGNLYGVTTDGGAYGYGTVYELVRGGRGWKAKVLLDFCFECAGGQNPAAGLTYAGASSGAPYDGSSPLYGTAEYGGVNSDGVNLGGVAYALTPAGGAWQESVLYSFCALKNCKDGAHPTAALTMDAAGNLYGTTRAVTRGKNGGTIFKLAQSGGSWSESVLYTFCSLPKCTDGSNAYGSQPLLRDGGGNLLGVTSEGGNCGYGGCGGLVFKLDAGGAYHVIYAFCALRHCADGQYPGGALLLDDAGDLFGTTSSGGKADRGSVFELSDSALTTLYSFCLGGSPCADGAYPGAGVIMDAGGALYGTAAGGGSGKSGGTVFELMP